VLVVVEAGALGSCGSVVVLLLVVAECSTDVLDDGGGLAGGGLFDGSTFTTGAGAGLCWQAPKVNPSAARVRTGIIPYVCFFIVKGSFGYADQFRSGAPAKF
jgi:hypothetical protein